VSLSISSFLGRARAEERHTKTAHCNLRMVEYYDRTADTGELHRVRHGLLRRLRRSDVVLVGDVERLRSARHET
jgi:hypothetical protein